MIENQDGTFTWETGDIITAEKMNLLLEKNTCHIIELEMKRNEGDNVDRIEASYNNLLRWIKNSKIIYVKVPTNIGNQYFLLTHLYTGGENSSPTSWGATFSGGLSFDFSDPDSYLYQVGAM